MDKTDLMDTIKELEDGMDILFDAANDLSASIMDLHEMVTSQQKKEETKQKELRKPKDQLHGFETIEEYRDWCRARILDVLNWEEFKHTPARIIDFALYTGINKDTVKRRCEEMERDGSLVDISRLVGKKTKRYVRIGFFKQYEGVEDTLS